MKWVSRLFDYSNSIGQKEDKIKDNMKYLIVGLGNMGTEYENTRHNIGFLVIDQLVKEGDGKVEHESLGDLSTIKFKGRAMNLLKPSTFMNLSGKSVRYWMQKKKILHENLLIVVDDIHLPFGQVRIRKKGGDGGHNGLRDIDKMLGTNKYNRLRIGIGNDFYSGQQSDYVLGEWSPEELEQLSVIIEKAVKAVKSYVHIGIQRTMNEFSK